MSPFVFCTLFFLAGCVVGRALTIAQLRHQFNSMFILIRELNDHLQKVGQALARAKARLSELEEREQ